MFGGEIFIVYCGWRFIVFERERIYFPFRCGDANGGGMRKMNVTVIVERPLGSFHPKHKEIFYTVNYGYIEGRCADRAF